MNATGSVIKHVRGSLFRTRCFLLLALVALPLLLAAAPPSIQDAEPPSALEIQVRAWTDALAAQKPFAAWKRAQADIQALGPGTHGWLAVLKSDGKVVGYLVVYAAQDGTFQLGEYGTGPGALFSPSVLRKTLLENGLIASEEERYEAVRRYDHPFAAVWEVTVHEQSYWIDAKLGEILPFTQESWNKLPPSRTAPLVVKSASPDTIPEASLVRETFDPYERLPWLTDEQPLSVHNAKKVQNRIRSGLHLRYVTEPYGDAVLFALPVIGFVQWTDGRLDLALDMDGCRFIPLQTLEQYGRFFR